MGDVHQRPGLDLGVTLLNPGLEGIGIELWVALEGEVDGVDDEVQKIGFIVWIALRAGEYHPVGAARIQEVHPGSPQMLE
jgi:hypothetical protein